MEEQRLFLAITISIPNLAAFWNRLYVAEQEAYERDTSYWAEKRGAILSPEEQRLLL